MERPPRQLGIGVQSRAPPSAQARWCAWLPARSRGQCGRQASAPGAQPRKYLDVVWRERAALEQTIDRHGPRPSGGHSVLLSDGKSVIAGGHCGRTTAIELAPCRPRHSRRWDWQPARAGYKKFELFGAHPLRLTRWVARRGRLYIGPSARVDMTARKPRYRKRARWGRGRASSRSNIPRYAHGAREIPLLLRWKIRIFGFTGSAIEFRQKLLTSTELYAQ